MNHFSIVGQSYRDAWSRLWVFVTIQTVLQVAAWVVIAPALADQDIAMFLLIPGGFIAAIGVLGVLLVATVWGFAMMAAVLRAGPLRPGPAARLALVAVVRRARALFWFAVLFVLRVLALTLPFVVLGLLVARRYLGEFDINYYLTFRPPEFLIAMAIIGALGLIMAVILLRAFTGWALALHLVAFANTRPVDAFRASAERMQGQRAGLAIRLAIWLAVQVILASVLAALAALVLNLVPLTPGTGLRLALSLTLIIAAVWALATLVLSALTARATEIIGSIPGLSKISAAVLLTEMPELGTLTKKQAANLAGLAPITRQSGQWRGKAFIQGGRKLLRNALYLPLSPCVATPPSKTNIPPSLQPENPPKLPWSR